MVPNDKYKKRLRGANWNGARRKWFAQISVNGIKCYLGMFENAEAAHLAYTAAAADKADGTFWAKYTPAQ